jgi:hypothetical protein
MTAMPSAKLTEQLAIRMIVILRLVERGGPVPGFFRAFS